MLFESLEALVFYSSTKAREKIIKKNKNIYCDPLVIFPSPAPSFRGMKWIELEEKD